MMPEKCTKCGKEDSRLIVYGRDDLCQECLDVVTGRSKPKQQPKQSLEEQLFGDQEVVKKCVDCRATENLNAVATRENGDIIWRCDDCKATRERENRERAARNWARVSREAARDRWEEPRR